MKYLLAFLLMAGSAFASINTGPSGGGSIPTNISNGNFMLKTNGVARGDTTAEHLTVQKGNSSIESFVDTNQFILTLQSVFGGHTQFIQLEQNAYGAFDTDLGLTDYGVYLNGDHTFSGGTGGKAEFYNANGTLTCDGASSVGIYSEDAGTTNNQVEYNQSSRVNVMFNNGTTNAYLIAGTAASMSVKLEQCGAILDECNEAGFEAGKYVNSYGHTAISPGGGFMHYYNDTKNFNNIFSEGSFGWQRADSCNGLTNNFSNGSGCNLYIDSVTGLTLNVQQGGYVGGVIDGTYDHQTKNISAGNLFWFGSGHFEGTFDASIFYGDGTGITNLPASSVNSGNFSYSQLPAGTVSTNLVASASIGYPGTFLLGNSVERPITLAGALMGDTVICGAFSNIDANIDFQAVVRSNGFVNVIFNTFATVGSGKTNTFTVRIVK